MEQLSPEDARILALESPVVAGHISKVLFLGGPTDAGALAVDDVVRRVASRLAALPRLRLRLSQDGHTPPAWVADERPVAARHVRRLEGVGRGGAGDLRRALGRLVAERLPRDRPLWRLDVVEELDAGRSALVFAAHHCLLDGEGALQAIRTLLFDEPPDPAPGDRAASAPSAGRAAPPVAGTVPRPAGRPHDRGLAAMAVRELVPASASSPLAHGIGARREVALATVPLDAVRACGHAAGAATVNDVLLAMVAGGLRRWLAERGSALREVRVKVPVSLHHQGPDPDVLGNRDSYLFVDLPLAEPDAGRRLEAISQQTRVRKSAHDAEALDMLQRRLGHLPGARHALASWTMSPRVFALNVSNVRGPAGPVSVLGRPLTGMAALAEIAPQHALRVAAVSAIGTLSLGLCADADVVGDPTALADGMAAELAALSPG